MHDDETFPAATGEPEREARPPRTDPRTPPPEVAALGAERAEARAARDWARADALKARIEAAGWKVEDAGRGWSLYRMTPADVEVDGEERYGSSGSVPSVLPETADASATVVLVADDDPASLASFLAAAAAHLPGSAQVVVVANDPSPETADALPHGGRLADDGPAVEVVRTSVRLGRAAALNAGLRRARGAVAILADGSLVPSGDAISPLSAALDDPDVAVAGAIGLTGRDVAHLGPTDAPAPAAIGAGWLAFRRDDYARLGPLDEGFVAPDHLDAWWSFSLRAGAPADAARRAARLDLPLATTAHAGPADAPSGSTRAPARGRGPDDRASTRPARRNAYRVLDAFRDRPDLLAGGDDGPSTGRAR